MRTVAQFKIANLKRLSHNCSPRGGGSDP